MRYLGILLSIVAAHGLPSYLWLVDASGKQPRLLSDKPLDDLRTAWRPDGKQLLFTAGMARGSYLLDLATKRDRQIIRQGDYGGIVWAARYGVILCQLHYRRVNAGVS